MLKDKVLHPDFAERFQLACEGNPHVPPQHYGRLGWIVKQLEERHGIKTSAETIRRWSSGEARPRNSKMKALAELLQVDAAWLSMGNEVVDTPKARKLRDAEQDGAVNIVAGAIRMCGGSPAFPAASDKKATEDLIDLFAIIKGAQYAIHVTTAATSGDSLTFAIPAKAKNAVVIAVVMSEGMNFSFFEMPWDQIEEVGQLKSGAFTFEIPLSKMGTVGARKIETFAERI